VLLALIASSLAEEEHPGLVEVSTSNFPSKIEQIVSTYDFILFEFYAHWCPACRAFQPTFISIAEEIQSRGDTGYKVAVARLDCADNAETCSLFGIKAYPTMLFGKPEQFAAKSSADLIAIDPPQRTSQAVIQKVDEEVLKRASTGTNGLGHNGAQEAALSVELGSNVNSENEAKTADLVDIEGATVESWKYAISPTLLNEKPARAALLAWLELVIEAHPIERCRFGATEAKRRLNEVWPIKSNRIKDIEGLKKVEICVDTAFDGKWKACAGSSPHTRGYTCGLWQLFHSLSVRLASHEIQAGKRWLTAVRGFIKHFFQCSDCARHFLEYATSHTAEQIINKRDAVMWLWRTHNVVNDRLATEEEANNLGDTRYPKLQWPSKETCASCHLEGERSNGVDNWVEGEVYEFLIKFYIGEDGQNPSKVEDRINLKSVHGQASSWSEAGVICLIVGFTSLVVTVDATKASFLYAFLGAKRRRQVSVWS
jgi:thiol oxidase